MSFTKVWNKKSAHIKKLAIRRKSTVFVQSSWKLAKMITPWGIIFTKFHDNWTKTVDIFINGQILILGPSFCSRIEVWGNFSTELYNGFFIGPKKKLFCNKFIKILANFDIIILLYQTISNCLQSNFTVPAETDSFLPPL